MGKIHVTLEFGCMEEVRAFFARGTVLTPDVVEAAVGAAIDDAIPPKKGRGRPRKEAPVAGEAPAPVAEEAPAPAPVAEEAPAPAPVAEEAPTTADVRAALIRYASAHGNDAAKALLPAEVKAVRDLTPEQCVEVMAKIVGPKQDSLFA